MLSTAQSAQYVNKINEAYKANVANPIDRSRAHAWKNVLAEEQSRQAVAIVGNYTQEREDLARTLKFLDVVGLDRPLSNWDMYLICLGTVKGISGAEKLPTFRYGRSTESRCAAPTLLTLRNACV